MFGDGLRVAGLHYRVLKVAAMASGASTSSGFAHALLSSPGLLMIDYLDGRVEVHAGDCLDVLREMADNSIDSVVTDPPYALTNNSVGSRSPMPGQYTPIGKPKEPRGGFMGKKWDTGDVAHTVEFWTEVLRVLKPGGHVLAFAGTRTYHRLACAIEDAGFEIRDQVGWVYGSGFPKSHDVSKGIDKAVGVEREVVGVRDDFAARANKKPHSNNCTQDGFANPHTVGQITAPATDAARQWQGWGTALKPAWEPICMARKPIEGTVAQNVLKHGTGAINVDGCRIGIADVAEPSRLQRQQSNRVTWEGGEASGFKADHVQPLYSAKGRWPANLIHDGSDEVVGAFPESKDGVAVGGKGKASSIFGTTLDRSGGENQGYGGSGSAARFFYQVKPDPNAPPKGRWPANLIHDGSDEVVGAFPESNGSITNKASPKDAGIYGSFIGESERWAGFGDSGSAARFFYHAKANKHDRMGSKHPTVKPVDLMTYLVRLVTPPGGTVLDPFAGTGTTAQACEREGFRCVLIEREAEYLADIATRMAVLANELPLLRA